MHKDADGQEIHEGSMVKILYPDEHGFNYLTSDAYLTLQNACKVPLKVDYLDDEEKISLVLPSTLEPDGDYVSNSITLKANEVRLIESTPSNALSQARFVRRIRKSYAFARGLALSLGLKERT